MFNLALGLGSLGSSLRRCMQIWRDGFSATVCVSDCQDCPSDVGRTAPRPAPGSHLGVRLNSGSYARSRAKQRVLHVVSLPLCLSTCLFLRLLCLFHSMPHPTSQVICWCSWNHTYHNLGTLSMQCRWLGAPLKLCALGGISFWWFARSSVSERQGLVIFSLHTYTEPWIMNPWGRNFWCF